MTENLPPTPPPIPQAGPALGATRIDSIDVLRGFALMGILVMNIQAFSMPSYAYSAASAYGNLEGLNFVVWVLGSIFFDMKFMAMFSMLFGAGIVLMSQHRDAAGKPVVALHYRRMVLLLIFGLIHAYLIWWGDILVAYAVCGMIVFWARRLPTGFLVSLGAVLIVIGSGIFVLLGLGGLASEEFAEEMRASTVSTPEELEAEVEAHRGGWTEHLKYRVENAGMMHIALLPLSFGWRICGLMLIGMGLFKWGVLSAQLPSRTYVRMAMMGGGLGLPLTTLGAITNWSQDFDPVYTTGIGLLLNWFGSVGVALMWIALVMLFVQSPFGCRIKSVLGAYGRTAFTNYIGQTLLATFVFYGYGLGLFGSMDRVGQFGIVIAIWAVGLTISPIWLNYFQFGPLEWVWRSGAYKELQPMRRKA
jgi:uncharacterized protein